MEEIKQYWLKYFQNDKDKASWWNKKQVLWKARDGEIVKVQVCGRKYQVYKYDHDKRVAYDLYLKFLIKQNEQYHVEEQRIPGEVRFRKGKLIEHLVDKQTDDEQSKSFAIKSTDNNISTEHRRPIYDRREAVRYAERWWNDYNPLFRVFSNDCTNYISQCLLAGGAPMRGAPDRNTGWWYNKENWSFSWSVAHSLRWYLSGSTEGLQGEEVATPEELALGDVICYDFTGDGRWDHTTIVVRHDAYGMPLVNAHTDNSRNRYWSYEDSSAWTPNIQYKFFRISI